MGKYMEKHGRINKKSEIYRRNYIKKKQKKRHIQKYIHKRSYREDQGEQNTWKNMRRYIQRDIYIEK